jgi:uncharacterized protein (UPF0332 family)
VKPETAAFLAKARQFLDKAHELFGVHHWPDETGRAAYLAGVYVARALIFETTGKITKSHKRARTEFARLTKEDPRFDRELRAFPGRAFNLKKLADYDTGPGSEVSLERATEAISIAQRFYDCVVNIIPPTEPEPEPRSR